ncbi:SIR2 family protein [Microbulbifer variabilis]|uniref:SIR2 family protein n=1 Tax=Microbulbifer variabilis TaxID=266805 RepID=A0ABY4VAT9_9GAMM|nr:SIR2 family protein [Microbulbifer variabilis]USD21388.1 SIR2 family protein [Microbulbifer variabilis]
MEYLKEQFNIELQTESNTYIDEGRIHIREMHWSPDEMLGLIDENVYDQILNEWFDERKQNYLQIADEILEKYDNRDRYESLKETFQEGVVIPFIGAGMSISSNYPGWKDYLRKVCSETRVDLSQLNKLMATGKYEEAAQLLFDDMGAASFNEHLKITFSRKREIKGPVNYLPKIFNSGVITTNFDSLLERTYADQGLKFEEIMLGNSASEFPRLAATGKPFLLKLHGHANRQRDRVLTFAEYEAAYSEKAVLRTLVSHTFFAKTMLFMGCSLSSDRTLKLMADYVEEFGHENLPQHYAIVNLHESEDRIARREQLVAANIFPIWYESSDHDEAIEALLLDLVDGNIKI